MQHSGSRWQVVGLMGSIMTTLGCTSCCVEPVPVAGCSDSEEPSLILTAVDRGGGELPILVAGRACGGASIDQAQLEAEYEVIIYAETDRHYIQPFGNDFRHRLRCATGYFEAGSHDATVIHAFLARRGLGWPAELTDLPEVDGTDMIAYARFDFDNPPPREFLLTTDVRGKGQVDPEGGTYRQDEVVELNAQPESGWRFAGWEGDVSGADAVVTLTMNGDKSLIAVFDTEPLPFEPEIETARIPMGVMQEAIRLSVVRYAAGTVLPWNCFLPMGRIWPRGTQKVRQL